MLRLRSGTLFHRSSARRPSITPTVDAALAAIDRVDGWLTAAQASRLFAAAEQVPAGGRIIEIGSFRGRSTIVLALAADPDVEIVAIDPHAGNDRGPQEIAGFEAEAATDNAVFRANLASAGVADRVRHVRSFSDGAHGEVSGAIDVLFVDGAHRYGPALADLRSWGDRVCGGGTLLVHDSFSSIGVTLALLRALVFSGGWLYAGRSGSLTEYRREPVTGSARAANVARQLGELPWFLGNVARKVLIVLRLRRGPWPY
jgi:predicted O-methyltransferase YrrM